MSMAPVPDAAPHDEPAVAVQVQVTPVNASAKVSVTVAPVAVLGPALVTTSVQVSGAPALTVAALGVLVIARSATSCGVAEAEALSFSGFGSIGALAWRLAVLVTGPSARTRTVIDSVWVAVAGMAPTVHSPLAGVVRALRGRRRDEGDTRGQHVADRHARRRARPEVGHRDRVGHEPADRRRRVAHRLRHAQVGRRRRVHRCGVAVVERIRVGLGLRRHRRVVDERARRVDARDERQRRHGRRGQRADRPHAVRHRCPAMASG